MNQTKLAIQGGNAIFPSGPPAWPIADDTVLNSIETALADGSWGRYESPWTEELAVLMGELSACTHVLLCSSGTIAVEIALRSLDIRPGSEVILAAYDFPGNFRAIEAIGAQPVIIDVVPGGWVIDADELESAITPQTSAVIASHLHGQFADVIRIKQICEQHGIRWVEDACQTPGAVVHGKPTGCWGDVAVHSFGGSKLLSAGRGGAVVTDCGDCYQRAKIYCNRGNEAFPLSALQAAALIPQAKTIVERNKQRDIQVRRLLESTEDLSMLNGVHQIAGTAEDLPAYYKVPWLVDDAPHNWTRSEFVEVAQAEGVGIAAGFRGFTRRSAKRCRHHGPLINARIAAQQTIILHHPILLESNDIIDQVAIALQKISHAKG